MFRARPPKTGPIRYVRFEPARTRTSEKRLRISGRRFVFGWGCSRGDNDDVCMEISTAPTFRWQTNVFKATAQYLVVAIVPIVLQEHVSIHIHMYF